MTKRSLFILASGVLLLLFSGCRMAGTQTDISQLSLIQMLGIDRGEEENVRLTILNRDVQDISGKQNDQNSQQQTGQNKQSDIISYSTEEGTMPIALEKLEDVVEKKLFWSHADYCLVGEEAAKENLLFYVNTWIQDSRFNTKARLMITEGKAGDLMEALDESVVDFFLPDYLNTFYNDPHQSADSMPLSILQYYSKAAEDGSVIAVPMLHVDTDENGNPYPDVCGFAIIKENKMIDKIEDEMTTGGYLILTNQEGHVYIPAQNEFGLATLHLDRSQTKIEPVFTQNELSGVNINISVQSSIVESKNYGDIEDPAVVAQLERQQKAFVEKCVRSCLGILQRNGADFLDIGGIVNRKKPYYYEKAKRRWEEIISQVKFTVNIESEVGRTYSLKNDITKE